MAFLGCASQPKPVVRPQYSDTPIEQEELRIAQKKASDNQLEAAIELFDNFVIRYPSSVYTQAAVMAKSDAQMKLQAYSEAAQGYRSVVEKTREFQPEIAAQAMYKLSFPYEEMGDEAKLIATLEDAIKFGQYLDLGVSVAEIPARMGAAYLRLGMLEESKKYFFQAQNGISQIKSMEPDNSYLASIYFKMGNFSTHQMSFESLKVLMDTMNGLQLYLLKCIELGTTDYGAKCSESLNGYYQKFYQQIKEAPLNQSLDRQAAVRQQKFNQSQLIESLLSSIQDLWSFRAVDQLSQNNSNPFFDQMLVFEKRLSNDLLRLDLSLPQTSESIERMGAVPTFIESNQIPQEPSSPNEEVEVKTNDEK